MFFSVDFNFNVNWSKHVNALPLASPGIRLNVGEATPQSESSHEQRLKSPRCSVSESEELPDEMLWGVCVCLVVNLNYAATWTHSELFN